MPEGVERPAAGRDYQIGGAEVITVRYEEYHNDYFRKEHERRFANLEELEEWMFGQMKQNYSSKEKGWLYMYFPVNKEPSRIQFSPQYGGPDLCLRNRRLTWQ